MRAKFKALPHRVNVEFLHKYDELDEPGEPRLAAELIFGFLGKVPSRIEALKRAIEGQDSDQAFREAHALKNEAFNVGAERLAAEAEAVERFAGQDQVRLAQPRLPDLEKEVDETKHELEIVLRAY